MKSLSTSLTIVVLACASAAWAQPADHYSRPAPVAYGVPGAFYGFGGPVAGHVHHASTVFESAYRGVASVIQARGQYNLLTSLAMMNAAQAERMELENRQRRAETYLAMRQSYQERKTAEYQARRNAARQANPPANQDAQPAPAVSLIWPSLLEQNEYAGYRALIERALAQQAQGRQLAPSDSYRMRQATKILLTKLRRDTSPEAASAIQFVENLLSGPNAVAVQLAQN